MKKLINKLFDRMTPKLPQHCAIEPVREPFKNEECLTIHNNSTPIVEEKTPAPMTEKEKLVIDKLYALLGTKEVYSSYSSYDNCRSVYRDFTFYYGFKVDGKNTVEILKIVRNEMISYEVVTNYSKYWTKVLENPSTQAILELEEITKNVKHKIDIQNLEKEQEKLDNFLKL